MVVWKEKSSAGVKESAPGSSVSDPMNIYLKALLAQNEGEFGASLEEASLSSGTVKVKVDVDLTCIYSPPGCIRHQLEISWTKTEASSGRGGGDDDESR